MLQYSFLASIRKYPGIHATPGRTRQSTCAVQFGRVECTRFINIIHLSCLFHAGPSSHVSPRPGSPDSAESPHGEKIDVRPGCVPAVKLILLISACLCATRYSAERSLRARCGRGSIPTAATAAGRARARRADPPSARTRLLLYVTSVTREYTLRVGGTDCMVSCTMHTALMPRLPSVPPMLSHIMASESDRDSAVVTCAAKRVLALDVAPCIISRSRRTASIYVAHMHTCTHAARECFPCPRPDRVHPGSSLATDQ
jgi:hypothetical protein